LGTLQDVIAVLELRIGVETESRRPGRACGARSGEPGHQMRNALDAFIAAVEEGRDAVGPDFQFHLEIARATQNSHFVRVDGDAGRDDDSARPAGAAGR
jgi:GntR family transcriptional repressor for pyruvate dehydrogenase complex